MPGPLWVKMLA